MDPPNQNTTRKTHNTAASNRRTGPPAVAIPIGCAACTDCRNKCSVDCPLAPYFPFGTNPDFRFRNVHILFNISNVIKFLKRLPEYHRETAINALINASSHAVGPDGGCVSIIRKLMHHINSLEMEVEMNQKEINRLMVLGRTPTEQMMGRPFFNWAAASEQGNVYGGGGGKAVLDGQFPFDGTESTGFFQEQMPGPGQARIQMGQGGPFPDYVTASEQGMRPPVIGGGENQGPFNQGPTPGPGQAQIGPMTGRPFPENNLIPESSEQGLNRRNVSGGEENPNLDRTGSQQYGSQFSYFQNPMPFDPPAQEPMPGRERVNIGSTGRPFTSQYSRPEVLYNPKQFDPPISVPQPMSSPRRVEIDSMGRPILNDQRQYSVDEVQRDVDDPKKKRELN